MRLCENFLTWFIFHIELYYIYYHSSQFIVLMQTFIPTYIYLQINSARQQFIACNTRGYKISISFVMKPSSSYMLYTVQEMASRLERCVYVSSFIYKKTHPHYYIYTKICEGFKLKIPKCVHRADKMREQFYIWEDIAHEIYVSLGCGQHGILYIHRLKNIGRYMIYGRLH